MDLTECGWCGMEIEDAGIDHKGLVFCSRDCIKDWDEDTLTTDDIDLGDLDDVNVDYVRTEDLDEELGEELGVSHDDDLLVIDENDF